MKSKEKLEIAMPGSSSWMSYAPQGVKGFDDDDDDDDDDDVPNNKRCRVQVLK